MRPYDATTGTAVLVALRRDNKDFGSEFWMLTDGFNVTIRRQKVGQSPTEGISIPVKTFNKMVDFWMADQATKRPAKRGAKKAA